MKNIITDSDKGKITIFSGGGERGTRELYTGKHTDRALKSRLTKERCSGDRWAKAEYHPDGYTSDAALTHQPEVLDL
jgi:hypothetical protein